MLDRQRVSAYLVNIACARKVISYHALAAQFDLDFGNAAHRSQLTNLLNEISMQENAEGRPLLPAVVVRPETGYPSQGFFLLARELTYNHFGDERSYYYHELQRVHDFWQANIPATQTIPYMFARGYEIRVSHR
jgi:hypothetical protein